MNFGEVVTEMQTLSGNLDINFELYINKAQRLLDRRYTWDKNEHFLFKLVQSGDYMLYFDDLIRTVLDVWHMAGTIASVPLAAGGTVQLEEYTPNVEYTTNVVEDTLLNMTTNELVGYMLVIHDPIYNYAYRITSNTDTAISISPERFNVVFTPLKATHTFSVYSVGDLVEMDVEKNYQKLRRTYKDPVDSSAFSIPLYWTPKNSMVPDQSQELLEFAPTADGNYIFQHSIRKYTDKLVNTNDTTWWSVYHHDLLINTTFYLLERALRNGRSAIEMKTLLDEDILMLQHDDIEHELGDQEPYFEG